MSLFTVQDREDVKDFFLNLTQHNDNIISLILVGSGSIGFTDELSDLDFCIVVDNEDNIEKTMDDIISGIRNNYQVIAFDQILQRNLQVCILNNFLEMDIGYVSIDSVTARRGRWKVLFDKSETVDYAMKKSWESNSKENHGKTDNVDINDTFAEYASGIWHPLFYAAVAIKRSEYWRSIGEMDIARNMLIELKGYRYSLETKRYRDVDNFPNDDLMAIHKSYFTELSQVNLLEKLYYLVDIIYDELETYCEKHIVINRHQVVEYITGVFRHIKK